VRTSGCKVAESGVLKEIFAALQMISNWSYIIRLVVSYPTEFFCTLRTNDVSRHSCVLKVLNLNLSCRDLTEVLGLRGNLSGAIGNLTSLQTL